MLNFITKLRNRNADEQGSAMIFTLVITIIALSIVTTVTAFGLANLQKTMFTQSYANNGLAAETALQNAVQAANSTQGATILRNALTTDPASSNSIKGTISKEYASGLGTQKWVWYTERISQSSATNKYYIHAIGYVNSPTEQAARHYRAVIESVADMRGTYDPNTNIITYQPNEKAIAQWGMLGSKSATLWGNVKVKSFLSENTLNPTSSTGFGQVASNGVITVGQGNAIGIDNVELLNYNVSDPNRCMTLTECATIRQVQVSYKTDLTEVKTVVVTACPLDNYPIWTASANGGVLEPGCYNSLNFDTNTTISGLYNDNTPARVYIKGDIKQTASVSVNANNSPLALQIFSQGGTSAVFNQSMTTTPTVFNGIIAGGALTCTDNSSSNSSSASAKLKIFGALACDNLNFGGGTELWWDELSTYIGGDATNVRKLWYITKYEEIYG